MSYALPIRPLIIEDDVNVKEAYERMFAHISQQSPWNLLPPIFPCFALSYEDGLKQVESDIAFHLVLLDLELPKRAGIPAPEGLDFGYQLLDACIARDAFPVPSILVISGHVEKTEQTKLQSKVSSGCFYGKVLTKGGFDLLQNEIEEACRKLISYCAVGIHLREASDLLYPVISPREEDLLRRSVIELDDAIGVDLSWWSADLLAIAGKDSEWTKVLLGRHILAHGHGTSHPRFFKLYPGGHRSFVVTSARQLAHQLRHISVVSDIGSANRALLVTESAVGTGTMPISLAEYLKCDQRTEVEIEDVLNQISLQLQSLGTETPDAQRLNTFIWKFHNLVELAHQIERCPRQDWEQELFDLVQQPAELLVELLGDNRVVYCRKRTLVHGDMHLTNVALSDGSAAAKAFLIDPASTVGGAPLERDLACLEVSALLHQVIDRDDFKRLCRTWYANSFIAQVQTEFTTPAAANTSALIGAIRKGIQSKLDSRLYALLAFDYIAIQVGGLAYGSSQSKVVDPYAAAFLARAAAQWYRAVTAKDP